MSRVARIELYHVAIPLPATFYPAWIPGMPQTENRFTLIRVTTDDGVVGHGAGPAIARERAGLGDLLGPYLLGEDATDIALIQQRLREISYLGWRNWWIEPAFWDIKGKLAGKPVCELLGGAPRAVRLLRVGRRGQATRGANRGGRGALRGGLSHLQAAGPRPRRGGRHPPGRPRPPRRSAIG